MLKPKARLFITLSTLLLLTQIHPAKAQMSDHFLTCSATISNQVALMKAAFETGLEKSKEPHKKLQQLQALYINYMYQRVKDDKKQLEAVSNKFQSQIQAQAETTKTQINQPDGIKKAISNGYKQLKSCNKKYFSKLFDEAKAGKQVK